MIINEKKNNLREEQEILGVRVQTSGIKSDSTAKSAIDNVVTKQAIVECNFSGDMLEGVDQRIVYLKLCEDNTLTDTRKRCSMEL